MSARRTGRRIALLLAALVIAAAPGAVRAQDGPDTPAAAEGPALQARGGPERTGMAEHAAPAGPVEEVIRRPAAGKIRGLLAGPDRVWVACQGKALVCLAAGGADEFWRVTPEAEIQGAPVVVGDRVVFGATDFRLRAVTRDGSEAWSVLRKGGITGAPLLLGGRVIAGDWKGRVFAVTPDDGTVAWDVEIAAGDVVGGGPAGRDGRLVVATRDGRLVCLSADDGSTLWSRTLGDEPGDVYTWCPPMVAGDRVVCGAQDGVVRAWSLEDGEPAWAARVGDDAITGPLATDGTSIFAGDWGGAVHAINPADGTLRWSKQVSEEQVLGGVSAAPRAGSDGTVVLAAAMDGRIAALDGTDGSTLWTHEGGGSARACPVVDADGRVVAAAGGQVLWLSARGDD